MTSGQNLDQWAASVIKQIGQYFKEKGQLKFMILCLRHF